MTQLLTVADDDPGCAASSILRLRLDPAEDEEPSPRSDLEQYDELGRYS
jgi:hypothetical protein